MDTKSMNKYKSIGGLSTNPSNKPVPNKPLFSFEFPTSPQSNVGEKLLHLSTHPKHPLARVFSPELFTCSGCKEYGAGKRVCCQLCEFQLHEFCAINSTLNYHPFHAQHQLLFQTKSKPGGRLRAKCDVCSKPTKGFAFKCNACSFQMHPCCAMLSTEMTFPIHPHALKLLPSISTGSDSLASACGECKRKRTSGRVYKCTVCTNYYLHAMCAKNMINGLRAHGINGGPQEKPSRFGAAARVASVVVMDFVGGLIEGIGEGVGEALLQNIDRGRDISSSSNTTGAGTRRSRK